MSLGSYNTVSVGTNATLIIAANPERKGLLVVNNGTSTVYLGPDASITTSNALPLSSGSTLIDTGLEDAFRGSLYGIVASSTIDVRYWEFIQ